MIQWTNMELVKATHNKCNDPLLQANYFTQVNTKVPPKTKWKYFKHR